MSYVNSNLSSAAGFSAATMRLDNGSFQLLDDVSHVRFFLYSSRAATLNIQWSTDGINTDLTDSLTCTAGSSSSSALGVKARYLALSVTNNDHPTAGSFRIQTLFFESPSSTGFLLENAGAGVQLYKPTDHKVRTLVSNDASVSLTQFTDTINITTGANPTITAANVNVQVTGAPSYIVGIGGPAGTGAFSFNLISDANNSANTINGDGGYNLKVGQGCAITRYNNTIGNTIFGLACVQGTFPLSGGVTAVGSNCCGSNTSESPGSYATLFGSQSARHACGDYCTVVGFNAMSNNGLSTPNTTNDCTIMGYNAGARSGDDCVIIGSNSSNAAVTGGANNIFIGSGCAASPQTGNDNTIIGTGACAAGGARSNIVALGSGCAVPGANGRLAFGSGMEAVQTTATAGVQTLPANPAGFIRIEWNGTLYKIPVYND